MEPEQSVQGHSARKSRNQRPAWGSWPRGPLRKMEGHWGEKGEAFQLYKTIQTPRFCKKGSASQS